MSSITENLIREELLPYFGLRGHAHLIEGASTDDYPATSPVNLIQTDQSFKVVFHWETKGKLNYIMCGKWKCQIFLELMGGEEFTLDPTYAIATEKFEAKPTRYSCVINVPPHKVKPGVYRIVASLSLEGQSGVPAPVAAFTEFGLVRFYSDGPQS